MTRSPVPTRSYYAPPGGHPPQTDLLTDRAVFTEAYAVIPQGVMRDIVTSYLPFWNETRLWVIARPLSGFAETFSQYIMEVSPGGGSEKPEPDPGAEGVLFVVEGDLTLDARRRTHTIDAGRLCVPPAGADWSRAQRVTRAVRFHWIRKAYEAVDGLDVPDAVRHQRAGRRARADAGHRRQLGDHPVHRSRPTCATTCTSTSSPSSPARSIPFAETHVMEHGLYVLEGKAVYRLNQDWVEVEAGDYMWLRAFCPQACYAGGPGRFRYLLYKDVNRHARLRA